MYNLLQKLFAEFLGTFAVVFFGAGAVCADFQLRSSGGLGMVGIALANGLVFAIMVSALSHISGGHFNPAITIGYWVTRRLSTLESLAYWGAQLAGGYGGGVSVEAGDSRRYRDERVSGYAGADAGFSAVVGNGAGGSDDVFPGAGGVRDDGGRTRDVSFGGGIRDRADDYDWDAGGRPADGRGYESGEGVWAGGGFESLAELGNLLGGTAGGRVPGGAALRFAVPAEGSGLRKLDLALFIPMRLNSRKLPSAAKAARIFWMLRHG